MKKFFVIALGFLWGLKASTQPAVLVATYYFDAVSPGGTRVASNVNYSILSAAGDFYNTATVLPIAAPPGYYANGVAGGNDRALIGRNWSNAFSTSKHFWCILTPIGGGTFVFDAASFYGVSSSLGPTMWQVRTSADGFAAPIATGTNPNAAPWQLNTIVPASTIAVSAPLEIRFYTYGTTNVNTTWRIDSVKFYGHLDGIFNLPVELTSFTGRAVENGVRLDWATASETDNDYFTVLRSRDAETWHEVDRVDGAGESQAEIRYRLLDASPEIGLNYYKLRQTDYEDAFEDSKVIAITWQPFDPSEAQVFDAEGKFIRNWDGDVFGLAPGTYVLRDKYNNTKKIFAPP